MSWGGFRPTCRLYTGKTTLWTLSVLITYLNLLFMKQGVASLWRRKRKWAGIRGTQEETSACKILIWKPSKTEYYKQQSRMMTDDCEWIWKEAPDAEMKTVFGFLKMVICILLRVLSQVQGFRLTQHWFCVVFLLFLCVRQKPWTCLWVVRRAWKEKQILIPVTVRPLEGKCRLLLAGHTVHWDSTSHSVEPSQEPPFKTYDKSQRTLAVIRTNLCSTSAIHEPLGARELTLSRSEHSHSSGLWTWTLEMEAVCPTETLSRTCQDYSAVSTCHQKEAGVSMSLLASQWPMCRWYHQSRLHHSWARMRSHFVREYLADGSLPQLGSHHHLLYSDVLHRQSLVAGCSVERCLAQTKSCDWLICTVMSCTDTALWLVDL
jgi:hypothetical protein